MNKELTDQARVCIRELAKFDQSLKDSGMKLGYIRALIEDLIRVLDDIFPDPNGR